MSEQRRLHRAVDQVTGESTEWEDATADEDTLEQMIAMHETLAQTLAWEHGGRYVLTRERFEKAYAEMTALSDKIVPEFRLSNEMIVIELMDGHTERPLIGEDAQA